MIKLTAQEIEKPKGMSLKATLAWNYLRINNGDWCAVGIGTDGQILVTDESCDLFNAQIFDTLNDFIVWLENVTDDAMADDATEFIYSTGMIDRELLSDGVIKAIISLVKEDSKIG